MQTRTGTAPKPQDQLFNRAPVAPAILRTGDVLAMLRVGRTTLWEMVRDGRFPQPLRLGARAVGWRAETVTAWIDSRPMADAANCA